MSTTASSAGPALSPAGRDAASAPREPSPPLADWTSIHRELRQLAATRLARERPGATLQATVLVHEAWLRLGADAQPAWQSRAHFFGAAAEAMRRILIDRARRRQARVRAGLAQAGDTESVPRAEDFAVDVPAPDDRLLAVHEAVDRLAAEDREAAELVKLRYFAGLSMPEAAAALEVPLRSAERLWTFARAWLREELGDGIA